MRMPAYQALVLVDAEESLSHRTPPMFSMDAIVELQHLGYRQAPEGAWLPPMSLVEEVRSSREFWEHVAGRIYERWPPEQVELTHGDLLLQACMFQVAVDEYKNR